MNLKTEACEFANATVFRIIIFFNPIQFPADHSQKISYNLMLIVRITTDHAGVPSEHE